MADYKIELGVKLDTSDIQQQINTASNNIKPIELKIDAETKELTNTIKAALNNLSKGTKNALTLDTSNIKASLDELSNTIIDIKTSLGTLDSKSGMKSLISSVNQIATALGKVENESDNLVKSLSALSKKDFSVNIGVKLGGGNATSRNADYGIKVRQEVLPELTKQFESISNAITKHYQEIYKDIAEENARLSKNSLQRKKVISSTPDALSDVLTKSGYDIGSYDVADIIKKINTPLKKGESLSPRIAELQKLINLMTEAAKMQGINLDSVISGFSKSADEWVKDAENVRNGTNELKESSQELKNLFGSGIDSEQLNSIVTNLGEIKTIIQGLSQNNAIDGLTQSFNKLSDTLDKLMTNAKLVQDVLGGVGGGTNASVGDGLEKQAQQTQQSAKDIQQAVKQTTDAYNQMSKGASTLSQLDSLNLKDDISDANKLSAAFSKLKNIQSNIKKIDIGNVDTSKGVQELKTLEKQLESLSAEYNQTVTYINQQGGVSATQFQSVQNEIKNTELKLEQLRANLAKKIKFNLAEGANGFEEKIKSIRVSIDKLKEPTKAVKSAFTDLNNALKAMNYANEKGDIQGLIDAHTNYQKALKLTQSYLKQNQQAEKQIYDAESLSLKKTRALQQIQNYLQDNTRAARVLGNEFRDLAQKIKACDDGKSLKHLLSQLQNLTIKANGLSSGTKSFGDKFKKQWQQYSSYLSVASLFQYAEQGLRSMFEQVKLIDSAMTELKKVTNETAESYNKFLTNAADRAREIGTTIDGLVSSTADFARLGYGFEDAQGLAEVANIYAVVGDEIEGVEGATESLISTMAAFKNEMNGMSNTDFAMSIIDKFNEIGNNFAISSGGIGEALERSASSLMAANNTIDESIALITASNQVVQDPTSVGTAWKTISMRIRGAKTEMSELGLDTEGMVESTAKLRSEILALSGVDIMEADNKTFKSTYQIMDELAQKWEDLSDIQQATVTELIAGKVFCQSVQKCA